VAESISAVVFGASTGGPDALTLILESLPAGLPFPIFVAQHLPPEFIISFTRRLAGSAATPILLASAGAHIENGVVYIAPGGQDTEVVHTATGQNTFSMSPSDKQLQPSVDKLMKSVATVYGTDCLGIILTGMGEDGLEGMASIKAAGGTTIAQNEETSVVFGMAKAVIDHGLADTALPLETISPTIVMKGTAHD
jgi:two-component system chemotaxis response regulator CheB